MDDESHSHVPPVVQTSLSPHAGVHSIEAAGTHEPFVSLMDDESHSHVPPVVQTSPSPHGGVH